MNHETYKCITCAGCQAMENEDWKPTPNCTNYRSGENKEDTTRKKLPVYIQEVIKELKGGS